MYVCPMHGDARSASPGKCPHCKMSLVPEGRFLVLRHMLSSPLHITIMVVVMLALMAAAMMAM